MSKEDMKTIKYVAFLRGIGPGDSRKSNVSLCNLFSSLGYSNVRSFISSGNILFESSEKDSVKLETEIEQAFEQKLKLKCATFIRSEAELAEFIKTAPFGDLQHESKSYLIVTFIKKGKFDRRVELPKSGSNSFRILSFDKNISAFCSVVDTTTSKTPDFMLKLESHYGKDITTRTWNTINRAFAKLVK